MTHNIKRRAFEASFFIVFGFGASQALRLIGNLILTRLLVPEMFGIISIANVFILGISFFSDIGLAPGIIRSKRSNDPVFLNTAWTIQVIRGIIIALLTCAVAYPISRIYNERTLLLIIPVISINSVISAFESTSLVVLNKELNQKRIVIMELIVRLFGMIIMVIVAYLTKSIWSLLISAFSGALFKTIWSHNVNTYGTNKFTIEKAALIELLSFGKWILLSTGLMFLATQTDRLLLGKLFTMTMFGVYSIALNFAELPKKVIEKFSIDIIYPLISNYLHLGREELKEKIRPSRMKLLLGLAVLVAVFGCFGDLIILFLYDDRYEAASWILPILTFGMWPLILNATIDRSLISIGKPMYIAFGNLVKFIYMIVCVPLLFFVGKQFWAVIGVAFNDLPVYIIISIGLLRERLSLIKQDVIATVLLIACIVILLVARSFLGFGMPWRLAF